MACYGKQEYWEGRYERSSSPCDWIAGYDLFARLLTPNFLCFNSATPPSEGVIHVQCLDQSIMKHLEPLLCMRNDRACVIDEESELEYSKSYGYDLTVPFPSRTTARVLNVGCGSSTLSADLIFNGWLNIVNVDYSKNLINRMQEIYGKEFHNNLMSCIQHDVTVRQSLGLESRDDDGTSQSDSSTPSMKYEYGDITKGINYPDQSFDLIICKKTLDVILCSAGSVAAARATMTECFRLLNNEHGVMMILSSGKPEDRAVFFENDPWTGVMNIKLPSPHDDGRKGHHKKTPESYVYILYKHLVPPK